MSDSTQETTPQRLRPIVAAILLPPAGGHFWLGRYQRGVCFLGMHAACGLLATLGTRAFGPSAMWIAIGIMLVAVIASIIDVWRLAAEKRPAPLNRGPALALLIVYGAVNWGLLRAYVVEAFKFPSGSMIPTVMPGDHFLIDKLSKQPKRGEIIVFTYPIDPDKDFLKRTVGIAGDTVQVCGGQVLLNGQPLRRERLPEPCAYDDFDDGDFAGARGRTQSCVAFREWNGAQSYVTVHNPQTAERTESCSTPFTVPDKSVFVMGDNRDNSHDSRFWGSVRNDLIKGKALFVFWSSGPKGVRWSRINLPLHSAAVLVPRSEHDGAAAAAPPAAADSVPRPAEPTPESPPAEPTPENPPAEPAAPPAAPAPDCAENCRKMAAQGQLKEGVSVESCIKTLCSQ